MGKEILLPKMGQTMEEAQIIEWNKKEGDFVSKGDILLTVETDKSTLEIEAEHEGYLQILLGEGSNVTVGSLLGYLSESNNEEQNISRNHNEPQITDILQHQQTENKPNLPFSNGGDNNAIKYRIYASPAARMLARKNNIELGQIKGSGTHGRIVLQDIQQFINETGTSIIPKLTQDAGKKYLSNMRKIIAKRMTESVQQIPQFQIKKSVNMTSLINLRNTLTSSFESSIGVKLSVNDFIIQAVALTLMNYPQINASFMNDEEGSYIVKHTNANIGLAVSIEGGLLVPVIHKVETMSLLQIAQKRHELVKKAQQNNLSKHELEGGTFTISNLASCDVEEFTAIINPPESGILAIGKTSEEVVARNGEIVIEPTLHITGSFDHRPIDGVDAANFLRDLMNRLEKGEFRII